MGGGIELALTSKWSARIEYLYTQFGWRDVYFPATPEAFDSSLSVQSIRLGFNYRLGENGGIDPQVFTKGISALDLGWFALHGQTTFVSQKRGIAETAEYQGNWTLRGGLFDLSMVPNSTDLDPHFG